MVPIEYLASGVGELEEAIQVSPVKPFTVVFHQLDQSDHFQMTEMVSEYQSDSVRVVVYEFLLRRHTSGMTDDRLMIFARGVVRNAQFFDWVETRSALRGVSEEVSG